MKRVKRCGIAIYHIVGSYCEILVLCRKRWPMEFKATFTRRLRPCVTMPVIPATTHPTSSTILYFSKVEM